MKLCLFIVTFCVITAAIEDETLTLGDGIIISGTYDHVRIKAKYKSVVESGLIKLKKEINTFKNETNQVKAKIMSAIVQKEKVAKDKLIELEGHIQTEMDQGTSRKDNLVENANTDLSKIKEKIDALKKTVEKNKEKIAKGAMGLSQSDLEKLIMTALKPFIKMITGNFK